MCRYRIFAYFILFFYTMVPLKKKNVERSLARPRFILRSAYHLHGNFGEKFANSTENLGRFGKNGKKVIPQKVLLFVQKISTGMNRSI